MAVHSSLKGTQTTQWLKSDSSMYRAPTTPPAGLTAQPAGRGGSRPAVRPRLRRQDGGPDGDQPARAGGRAKALDNVTLTVADGETLAVVGPSGCGKSTLLRAIAGLDPGYSGEIYYGQENVRRCR